MLDGQGAGINPKNLWAGPFVLQAGALTEWAAIALVFGIFMFLQDEGLILGGAFLLLLNLPLHVLILNFTRYVAECGIKVEVKPFNLIRICSTALD